MAATAIWLIAGVCATASRSGWTDPGNWQRLDRGMRERAVETVLGPPLEKDVGHDGTIWYYQAAPTRERGLIVDRPEAGIVRFRFFDRHPETNRRLGRPMLMVHNWVEPDWSRVEAEPAGNATVGWRQHAAQKRRDHEEREAIAPEPPPRTSPRPPRAPAPVAQKVDEPEAHIPAYYYFSATGILVVVSLLLRKWMQ